MRISGLMHTRNSERYLEEALRSLRWVDELVVVDMGSRDRTTQIAGQWADRVIDIPPSPRVDGVRNRAADETTGDWIMVLDSDEYLAADAAAALKALIATESDRYDAFALPRYNTIAGQIMRGGLWYPDHQIRLFRRGTVAWEDAHHRAPVVRTGGGRLLELPPPDCPHIHHHNYDSIAEFVRRQAEYAVTDRYDPNPASFDPAAAMERAHRVLALRHDPDADGDLSHALALLMAWDEVVRTVLHWEILDPRPSLEPLLALPPRPLSVLPRWEVRLRRWLGRRHSLRFALHRVRARLPFSS